MKSIACTIRVVVLLICSCLFYGEVPFVKLHNFQEKRKKGNDFEYIICMESWICLIYAFLYWKLYLINPVFWYNKSDKTFLSLITSEEVGHKLNITSIDAPLKNTLQSSNKNKMYLTLLGAISFRLFLLLWKYWLAAIKVSYKISFFIGEFNANLKSFNIV